MHSEGLGACLSKSVGEGLTVCPLPLFVLVISLELCLCSVVHARVLVEPLRATAVGTQQASNIVACRAQILAPAGRARNRLIFTGIESSCTKLHTKLPEMSGPAGRGGRFPEGHQRHASSGPRRMAGGRFGCHPWPQPVLRPLARRPSGAPG